MTQIATRIRPEDYTRHSANLPRYELRMRMRKASDYELEIWQIPSPATPRLKGREYIAGLKGTALRMLENRILRRLARVHIHPDQTRIAPVRSWELEEESALILGLLFRVLAPMRNLDRIREIADGIETMCPEEAGYWLGMAMCRKNPRRVLASLRTLLTTR